jgi:hypothetical protein
MSNWHILEHDVFGPAQNTWLLSNVNMTSAEGSQKMPSRAVEGEMSG